MCVIDRDRVVRTEPLRNDSGVTMSLFPLDAEEVRDSGGVGGSDGDGGCAL